MKSTRKMALLSIATSIVTLALKFGAYFLTDSVSLLSDALEAIVNLAAGLVALGALTIADQPADDRHTYGHDKAEYFSSGVEGVLILVAAVSIIVTASGRFLASGYARKSRAGVNRRPSGGRHELRNGARDVESGAGTRQHHDRGRREAPDDRCVDFGRRAGRSVCYHVRAGVAYPRSTDRRCRRHPHHLYRRATPATHGRWSYGYGIVAGRNQPGRAA